MSDHTDFYFKTGTGAIVVVIGFCMKATAEAIAGLFRTLAPGNLGAPMEAVLGAPLMLLITLAVAVTIATAHSEHKLPYHSFYLPFDLVFIALPLQGVATLAAILASGLPTSLQMSYGAWFIVGVFTALIVRSLLTLALLRASRLSPDEKCVYKTRAKEYGVKLLPFHVLGLSAGIFAALKPHHIVIVEEVGILAVLLYLVLWGARVRLRVSFSRES